MTAKELLFIVGTHGNEKIGLNAVCILESQGINISWIKGNERAIEKNVRYIEKDLNRVAPGNEKSNVYEERRAHDLVQLASNYNYVIDIHGTIASTGIFTIVTRETKENLQFAMSLPIKNIVIWPSTSEKPIGPITKFVKTGLEIECGPMNSKEIEAELIQIIKKIVTKKTNMTANSEKEIFEVYGKLIKTESNNAVALNEFKKVTLNGELFYPLIIKTTLNNNLS